jgi:hypothetical protein
MIDKGMHVPNGLLLQFLDGELGSRDLAAVERHLSACAQCEEQRNRIAVTMCEFKQMHSLAANEVPEAAGPRAMLRMRLAELHGWARPVWLRPRMVGALAYTALLALLLTAGITSLHRWSVAHQIASAGPLPDRAITPGSTRQVALSELCVVEKDETVRDVSSQLQSKVFREYGIDRESTSDFEVDYLITPGLGGSDDVRNLWPEPHANTLWNSYVKDQLEDHLHHLVCGGKLRLEEAQGDIASDWITAYKKYFHTNRPLSVRESSSVANIR